VVGAVVGLVLLAAGLGTPSPAVAQPATAPSDTAVQRFTSCLNSTEDGDLLLLVDESGSLRSSDPQGARVTAARYLLSRMSTFADRTGFRLDVAVAGFSDRFSMVSGWTPVGAATLPGLTQQVEEFADRNDGGETDYWTALEGARRALADQAPPGAGRRCQAVAWFSDGELDIIPRGSAGDDGATKPYSGPLEITSEAAADQAEAAAAESLCRPRGGLADQLRASGVVLFVVGLNTSGQPRDFDLMRSIATGESPSRSCGQPTDRRPGAFQLAEGIDGLLFAFDELIPPAPPIQQEHRTCPATVCVTERHSFVLDPSVGKVEILGSVDRAGIDAVLVPPSGAPIPLDPKAVGSRFTVMTGPSTLAFSWLSDRTVSVDLVSDVRTSGWTGEWALVFVDRTQGAPDVRSRTNVHVTGDLFPVWTNRPPVLHSGEAPRAVFGLVDGNGRTMAPSSVRGTLALTVALLSSSRPSAAVVGVMDKARLREPVVLDLRDVPPGPATLRLTLALRTASATRPDGTQVPGTQLAPGVVELPLQIAAPVGYPQVDGTVNFGTSDGETTLTGTLGVTGAGCVWAAPVQNPQLDSAPPDAGKITLSATDAQGPQSCLDLGRGEQGELELRLSTAQVGNGTVTGTLPVTVAPPGEPQSARQVPVAFTADLRKPLDVPVFWQVLLALVLFGAGIPLGLLYLAKWATARVPARPLLTGRVAVTVVDDQVRRNGVPFHLDQRDLDQQVPIPPRGGRNLVAHGVRMRARTGGSPFGAGHVRASVGDGRTFASADQRTASADGTEARLPLAVHNTWVVLHDPAGPPEEAEVLVLASGDDPTGQSRSRLEIEIAHRLPRVLARLRANHPPPDPSAPRRDPSPFGGPDGPRDPRGPSPFDDLGPSRRGGPTPPNQRTTWGDHW